MPTYSRSRKLSPTPCGDCSQDEEEHLGPLYCVVGETHSNHGGRGARICMNFQAAGEEGRHSINRNLAMLSEVMPCARLVIMR